MHFNNLCISVQSSPPSTKSNCLSEASQFWSVSIDIAGTGANAPLQHQMAAIKTVE
jgi:hypothetical protein